MEVYACESRDFYNPFSLECEKSQKGDLNTKIVLVKVLF